MSSYSLIASKHKKPKLTARNLGLFIFLIIMTIFLTYSYDIKSKEQSSISNDLLTARDHPDCADSMAQSFILINIPPRSETALTGTEFAEKTRNLPGRERQEDALNELRSGNVPEFLRSLKPVYMDYKARGGQIIQAIVWVSPDYLAIGSNEDYLRIPLTRPSAVIIAKEFGCVLPTRKIVDAIAKQAEFRFKPQPLPPGNKMRSIEYYVRHNKMIEQQHQGRPLGELVAGHKKDVVLTNRLFGPERIAIYGWHKKDGSPIQNLSTVHGARYADYSHGIRLVYEKICVDGQMRSIYEVLEDPKLAPVLSHEGLIPKIRRLMSWWD